MPADIQSSLALRTANPDDADRAAPLIHETMLTLGDYLFGQSGREGTVRALAVLFPEPNHLLSFTITTLAEMDGETVGLAQALPGADLGKAVLRLVRACAKRLGWGAAFRLVRRGYPLAFEPDAEPGEFYVNTLAVAASHRRRGIGRALLRDAERRTRELGFPICSLSVMLHNTEALRFYQRVGYRIDRKVISAFHAPGVQYNGFYRMIKPVTEPVSPTKGAAQI